MFILSHSVKVSLKTGSTVLLNVFDLSHIYHSLFNIYYMYVCVCESYAI